MMSSTPKLVRSVSTRSIKKVEKPKPLKTSPLHSSVSYSLDDLVNMIETASHCISKKNFNELSSIASALTPKLRIYGQRIEENYKDLLDKAFVSFRNGCREDEIDLNTRLNLLHLVELRAMAWHSCAATNQYYLLKGSSVEEPLDGNDNSSQIVGNQQQPLLLNPGEVIKSSGKFSTPTKMPGKNYCKDEVVIRNADSGKVMGIRGRRVHMIEELSETVISFQRVSPGAKERLVQITGPDGDKIEFARQLIEDTIKRNASPVRDLEKDLTGSTSSLNSTASEESSRYIAISNQEWKYQHTVHHQGKTLIMASSDLDFLEEAKLKLENSLKTEFSAMPEKTKLSTNIIEELNSSIFNPSTVSQNATAAPPKASSPTKPGTVEKEITKVSPSKENDADSFKESSPPTSIDSVKSGTGRNYGYRYNRQFLLECSAIGPSIRKPVDYQKLIQDFPQLLRTASLNFDMATHIGKFKDVQSAAALNSADEDSI